MEMQYIQINCPNCKLFLRIKREYWGKAGKCKFCDKKFTVSVSPALSEGLDPLIQDSTKLKVTISEPEPMQNAGVVEKPAAVTSKLASAGTDNAAIVSAVPSVPDPGIDATTIVGLISIVVILITFSVAFSTCSTFCNSSSNGRKYSYPEKSKKSNQEILLEHHRQGRFKGYYNGDEWANDMKNLRDAAEYIKKGVQPK